ncbi:unnamed protein product [Haemonchus placei]|uniref:Uncharacterized protein n=1 Tax=Haemonchus placei TaxID=6290 RepID=A0A3P7YCX3_HAEPC|nr:unnamed protein product [Haemonchus placei]
MPMKSRRKCVCDESSDSFHPMLLHICLKSTKVPFLDDFSKCDLLVLYICIRCTESYLIRFVLMDGLGSLETNKFIIMKTIVTDYFNGLVLEPA